MGNHLLSMGNHLLSIGMISCPWKIISCRCEMISFWLSGRAGERFWPPVGDFNIGRAKPAGNWAENSGRFLHTPFE
jgi:hypothetical protein